MAVRAEAIALIAISAMFRSYQVRLIPSQARLDAFGTTLAVFSDGLHSHLPRFWH